MLFHMKHNTITGDSDLGDMAANAHALNVLER
jgi:hypothetical protein